jgi:hypothetical protein
VVFSDCRKQHALAAPNRMNQIPPKALFQFLERYDRGIQELALEVRALVLEELQPRYEYVSNGYCLAMGYGPTERLKDGVCVIAVASSYVNLLFNQGAHMQDPDRLLRGTGKNMRHISIRTPEELEHPAIRKYLHLAAEFAGDTRAAAANPAPLISIVIGKAGGKKPRASAKKRAERPRRKRSLARRR